MALILETGLKVANANTYVTVDEANAYHTLYGNTDWTDLNDAVAEDLAKKELALIIATQSIDTLYGNSYKSYPTYQDQSLLFPRLGFNKNGNQYVGSNVIPKELKDTICEAALRYVCDLEMFPNLNTDSNIKTKESEIGPLKKKLGFFSATNTETYSGFGKIEKILRPMLKTTGTVSGYTPL